MSPKQSTLISIALSVGFVLFLFAIISRQPDVMPPAPPEFPTPSVFTPSPTDTIPASNISSTPILSDWSFYKNDQFSFQYPLGWKITETENNISVMAQEFRKDAIEGGMVLSISMDGQSVEEYVKNIEEMNQGITSDVCEQQQVILNQKEATKVICPTALGPSSYALFVGNGDHSYQITYDEYDNLHNQIISTFNFAGQ